MGRSAHAPTTLGPSGVRAACETRLIGTFGRRSFLTLAGAALVAAACEPRPVRASPAAPRPSAALAANGALDIWPEVYRRAPAETRQAYDYAVRRPRSLAYIPCYCGCGASGHGSNQDCYVARFQADGWVTLDTHGFG